MKFKKEILWADDEVELLKPQMFFLEKKGFSLITTTNGYDAIDLARENNFGAIILDYSMPGLNGMETFIEIRKFNKLTPILMLTKNENESLMEEAINLGFTYFLIKPVNPNQLLLAFKVLEYEIGRSKLNFEFEIELIKELQTSFSQYLSFFPEYVKATKKEEIEMTISNMNKGLKIEIPVFSIHNFDKIKRWLQEFVSHIALNSRAHFIDENPMKIEFLQLKIDLITSHFKNQIKLIQFEKKRLEETTDKLLNIIEKAIPNRIMDQKKINEIKSM